MKLNKEEIKQIIPHRDPMLLVDEVVEMEEEKSIITKFYIDPKREIFKGHFPDEPVLPGVYTVEIMAQTADVLILSCERYKGKTPLFIGIDKVRFLSKIKPGDTLEIHAKFSFEKAEKAIVTCAGEVYDNGVLACTGDVTLAMRQKNGLCREKIGFLCGTEWNAFGLERKEHGKRLRKRGEKVNFSARGRGRKGILQKRGQ